MKLVFDTEFLGPVDMRVFRKMIGHPHDTLPNVYKVTHNLIIREDCEPNTPKCQLYYGVATERWKELSDIGLTLERVIAQGNEHQAMKLLGGDKIIKEVGNWLIQLRKDLESIGVNVDGNLGDFRLSNLGETKDGRVVFFDW